MVVPPNRPSCRSAVVLDIDGVLADVRHRLHHLSSHPKNWDGFFAAAKHDSVLAAGAEFARATASTHTVVYLTGRPERIRADTQRWLDRHALPQGRLLMRPDGDRRPAAQVKLRHLRRLRDELSIDLLVDDDPMVVDAARALGFTARLAGWTPQPTDGGIAASHERHRLRNAQERDGRT